MKIEQIKEKLKTSEYDFLRENKNLGDNIILLTLGVMLMEPIMKIVILIFVVVL